jgi:hypothetical protein
MVTADGTIAGDSAAPCGARMAAEQSVAGPRKEAPQVKGKGPSVSEVSGFLSSEWNPFYIIFFPSKLMCFFKSSIRCSRP